MRSLDGIVIGGGHNGLVCAAYLARAGLDVAVVERLPVMGGGCSTEELTLPGFRHSPHSNFHVWEEGPVPADLELGRYGLSYLYPEIQHAMAFSDDTALCIHRDPERTAASLRRFSAADAVRYLELVELYGQRMAWIPTQMLYSPPRPREELAAALQDELGREYLSYGRMTMHEAVAHNFESPHVRSFFTTFMRVTGVEDIPGAGATFPGLFSRLTRAGLPVGGAVSVALALERCLERHGGTLIRGRHVARILSDDGRATGVRLDDGTDLVAQGFVASAIDAPQTIALAGPANFDPVIVEKLGRFEWADYSLATLHLALEEAPQYGASAFDPDVDRAANLILGADNADDVGRVFEEVRSGRLPGRLAGNGGCPTRFDRTLAPAGKHLAFWWPWAPYDLDGDPTNWDLRKGEVAEILLEQWRRHATNLNNRNILGHALVTPLDTERNLITMRRGSHRIGASLPQQMGVNRPIPELSGYRTPLAGLYLCGSTSHPGGAVSGAPAYNAANVIAMDLGLTRWWTPVQARHWPPSEVPAAARDEHADG
jgi:phytoene dehydrogenase-like protein